MAVSANRSLPMARVDLWWENIDSQAVRISDFRNILSSEERKRAERYRFDRHRRRFMAQRGRLREILSGYLNVAPEKIGFQKGPGGKPAIAGQNHVVRFNLSHSGGHALYAVSLGREVGVDVEVVRSKPKAEALVNRFFSPGEKAAFQKLDDKDKEAAFFAGWTRKEAYVKALGKGLRFSLDRFDVSLNPGDQNALLRVEGLPEEVTRWSLRDIDLGPGFRAALALEMTNESPAEDISTCFRSYGV